MDNLRKAIFPIHRCSLGRSAFTLAQDNSASLLVHSLYNGELQYWL